MFLERSRKISCLYRNLPTTFRTQIDIFLQFNHTTAQISAMSLLLLDHCFGEAGELLVFRWYPVSAKAG